MEISIVKEPLKPGDSAAQEHSKKNDKSRAEELSTH